MPQLDANLRELAGHVQAGRVPQAVEVCQQILAVQPDQAAVLHVLGVLSAQMGRREEGIRWIERAVVICPTNGEYRSNLTKLLVDAGRVEDAITMGKAAVRLWPTAAAPYVNLASALLAGRRAAAAAGVLAEGRRLMPGEVELAYREGNILRWLGRAAEALACYQEVLRLQPGHAGALNNAGLMQYFRGETDLALGMLTKAAALEPRSVEPLTNLRSVHMERGELEAALQCQRRAMELQPGDPGLHSDLIVALQYSPQTDARALRNELDAWWRRHGEPRARQIAPHGNAADPERRLRVGYVSADFRDHVVGRTMRHLIDAHDSRSVEVLCYADVESPDAITEEFRHLADGYRDIRGMSDPAAAALLRQDGIDVLVDLSLHTAGNRLPVFALKPAPVQVTFAGYPGSTGLPTMDYRLSDAHLDPPGGDETTYMEKTVRLRDAFFFFDVPADAPEVGEIPLAANGYVTVGNLGNFCKVNPAMLRVWAQVMAAIGATSRLLLLTDNGSHRERTREFLAGLGIAGERVEFVKRRPRREYLKLYDRIDLVLDTLPYNGHMTSLDAVFMGVPVVTLTGDSPVGRGGVSVLLNLGLPELVARTAEEFVGIAAGLARDRERLAGLRAGLRQRLEASPMRDARRMTGALEAAYREMWRTWCAGRAERRG